jgi:hypothetical protein
MAIANERKQGERYKVSSEGPIDVPTDGRREVPRSSAFEENRIGELAADALSCPQLMERNGNPRQTEVDERQHKHDCE